MRHYLRSLSLLLTCRRVVIIVPLRTVKRLWLLLLSWRIIFITSFVYLSYLCVVDDIIRAGLNPQKETIIIAIPFVHASWLATRTTTITTTARFPRKKKSNLFGKCVLLSLSRTSMMTHHHLNGLLHHENDSNSQEIKTSTMNHHDKMECNTKNEENNITPRTPSSAQPSCDDTIRDKENNIDSDDCSTTELMGYETIRNSNNKHGSDDEMMITIRHHITPLRSLSLRKASIKNDAATHTSNENDLIFGYDDNVTATIWSAMIVLNAPILSPPSQLFQTLWKTSDYHVCADGGANRLYNAASTIRQQQQQQHDENNTIPSTQNCGYIPDIITGDLDSLRGHVKHYYESCGVPIIPVACQDTNDLEKSINAIVNEYHKKCMNHSSSSSSSSSSHTPTDSKNPKESSPPYALRIIVYGAFGGRFDQEMASMQALYRYSDYNIVLYDDHTMGFLLDGGLDIHHHIHLALPAKKVDRNNDNTTNCLSDIDHDDDHAVAEGPICGLIPLGCPVESLTTTGLQWNLDHHPTSFGQLVSTSNRIIEPVVTIQTSHPIIFTSEIHSGGGKQF